MSYPILSNAFKQAVVGTYSDSATVIELASISDTVGNADYLPDGSTPFNVILYDTLFGNPADANNGGSYEIMQVTSVNYGDNEITVVRGQENSGAVTITDRPFAVLYGATAKWFTDIIEDKINFSDIVNDFTGGVAVPASAETVKVLNGKFKIVDVVHASTDTEVVVSTTTYTDTTLEATITPKSATNEIYILVDQQYRLSIESTAQFAGLQILRGSTVIYNPGPVTSGLPRLMELTVTGSGTTDLRFHGVVSLKHPDLPNTTDPVTYKTQGRPAFTSASGSAAFQYDGGDAKGTSTMTLIEVQRL